MRLKDCNKIIVFGGSFDPPHLAHVRLPGVVMQAISADAVAYVPTGVQPLKRHQSQTSAHHRLAMLELALADIPTACVLTDEIDRAGLSTDQDAGDEPSQVVPSYTVDTLEGLRQRLGPKVEMRLLIGGDNLRIFNRWHKPRRVIELAEPLVMVRSPDTREALLDSLPDGYDPHEWDARLIEVPRIDVSSTQIRQLVSKDQPISRLVAPAVEAYIDEHKLYRD